MYRDLIKWIMIYPLSLLTDLWIIQLAHQIAFWCISLSWMSWRLRERRNNAPGNCGGRKLIQQYSWNSAFRGGIFRSPGASLPHLFGHYAVLKRFFVRTNNLSLTRWYVLSRIALGWSRLRIESCYVVVLGLGSLFSKARFQHAK